MVTHSKLVLGIDPMIDGDYQISGDPPVDLTVEDGRIISVRPFHGMTTADFRADVAGERKRLHEAGAEPEDLPDIVRSSHDDPRRHPGTGESSGEVGAQLDLGLAPGRRAGAEEHPGGTDAPPAPDVEGAPGSGHVNEGNEEGSREPPSGLSDVDPAGDGSGGHGPRQPDREPEEDPAGCSPGEDSWSPVEGEPIHSCFNVPEAGVGVEIFFKGGMLYAEFTKPYAFDPFWAPLDDLVTTACGQDASWDGLSTLSMSIGDFTRLQDRARTIWITLVTAQKTFEANLLPYPSRTSR